MLGTVPASWALLIGRADFLAAALAVWGLALCAGTPGRWHRSAAALLFALAVLTKPSAAFAPLGAAAALALMRERGAALRLVATTAALAGLGLAATQAASGGRWLESFRATGSGGADLATILLEGPANLLSNVAPASVFLFALALAVVATTLGRRPPFLVPALLLCAATTVVLFGSPGVAENHLLDVCVLSIAVVVAAPGAGLARPLALALLALIGLLDLAYAGMRFAPLDMRPALATVAKVVGPSERGPLLAENPWVPLALGERPALLDAFTERIAAEGDPRIAAELLDRLDRHAFRAVVLMRPLESAAPSMGPFYEGVHFSQGFRAHLRARYWLAASHVVNARGFGVYVWLPNE